MKDAFCDPKTPRVVAQHADYSNPSEIRMTLHQDCMIGKDETDVQRLLEQFPSLWGEASESRRASGFVNWYTNYPATDSMELSPPK